jgi:hypothetical protein
MHLPKESIHILFDPVLPPLFNGLPDAGELLVKLLHPQRTKFLRTQHVAEVSQAG